VTNTPFILAQSNSYKGGFDFSPWGGLDGFLEASKAGGTGSSAALKRLVPDLSHAVDMTAVAVSGLPFDILDEKDNVYDSSDNWQNKLTGIPNPQKLIYLLASSLCGGSAYLIPFRTTKVIVDLQYCAPHTITEYIDRDGLKWFDRATDQGKTEKIYPNKIIYFWLPDSDVEIGPAKNNPLQNATLDAQIVYSLKETIRKFGERNFTPITLLGAKGMPNDPERQKAETFFDRLLRFGFREKAKIFNADALSIQKLSAGMDELKQSYIELRRDAKESIADAFGIPAALFMSDNAFASEFDALRKQWYTASRFVGIYQTISETMTDQLLKPYGYKMRFNLEALEVFQEDESKRAASLGSFVSAVSTDPDVAKLGMGILGYDLDKDQEAQLDKLIADKEEARRKMEEQVNKEPDMEDDEEPEDVEEDAPPEEEKPVEKEAPVSKSLDLSADEIKDLALWYDRAKQWFLKGKSAAVDWENKHLREAIAAPIRLKLAEVKSEADIALAFRISETTTPAPVYRADTVSLAHTEAIKTLVAVIEKAIEAAK
jgi:hypothetical protein